MRFIENENPASGKFHLKSGKSILGTLSKFINKQFKTRMLLTNDYQRNNIRHKSSFITITGLENVILKNHAFD